MDKRLVAELAEHLKRRRSSIIFGAANRGMASEIIDERESEIEGSAQLDRIISVDNHLEVRGQKTLHDIDLALDLLAVGKYGSCQICGEKIGSARLKALPTATLCIDCAEEREKKTRVEGNNLYSRIDFDPPEEEI
ncbi:MAG: TraR/DksA family transcriptional regulator [Deltaproteobacteria bacterium]